VAKDLKRLKEKAIAEKEHRVCKLTEAMQDTREDTRVNVERKFGMTDKERQQEIAALYAEEEAMTTAEQEGSDGEDGEEKVYNPLKLPLSWDGKPIPFWLYKLHGLGVEFPCEICGNYVYMGRRAFDKHFSEARHIYGDVPRHHPDRGGRATAREAQLGSPGAAAGQGGRGGDGGQLWYRDAVEGVERSQQAGLALRV
jgi:hypothetical protein